MTDPQPVSTPGAADLSGERRSLWAELRDAIRGTAADYTKIPLRRAVFMLAVPMVLELVLESTFAVVDIYFVGKLGLLGGRDGRTDRDDAVPAVRDRHGPRDGGDCRRRAADRRRQARGGRRDGGAGDLDRAARVTPDGRPQRGLLRSRT
jgi:hypothetical protein